LNFISRIAAAHPFDDGTAAVLENLLNQLQDYWEKTVMPIKN
jgi:hypothetical protein